MLAAVEIQDLRKVFHVRERAPGLYAAMRSLIAPVSREAVAVDCLSFRIERGERVAFVGQNGAGKSTTIKMLAGVLHPSAGMARVAGFLPWRERKALSYRIGTVFGQRTQLWYHLPVADSFDLLMHVYDQRGDDYRARRAGLIEAFGVGPHLHKPVRQLSLGERMRCEVVASLLHAPEVLFLDEPTIGLDVSAKATIREIVREQSVVHGRTLLLTSHDTGDMESVCERVIVIHEGRLVLDQPVAALRRGYIRKKRVVLQIAARELAVTLPGVRAVRTEPHRIELEVELDVTPVDALLQAVLKATHVQDLTIEDPPMDEIVQAIYRGAAPLARGAAGDPACVAARAEAVS
jgi:ABC-2 type transport system ATP-binding protein